jgi:hypothetical protein
MSNGGGPTDVVSAGNRAVNEPARRAIGYGEKATASGPRVAQAPAKGPSPQTPLDVAKATWARLNFNTDPALRGVTLHDISTAPSSVIKKNAAGVGAWTNSSTDIYVDRSIVYKKEGKKEVKLPEEVVITALVHEQWHIRQFTRDGGPPKTFCKMMEYELNAYALTARFLTILGGIPFTVKQPRELSILVQAQQWHADAFKAGFDNIKAAGLTGASREQACRDFLAREDPNDPDKDVYLPAEAQGMSDPTPLYAES